MNRAFQDIVGETFTGEVRGNFFAARFLRCRFDKCTFVQANLGLARFEECEGVPEFADRCRADGVTGLDTDKPGVLHKGPAQLPKNFTEQIRAANVCREYEEAVAAKTTLTREVIEEKARLDAKCARELNMISASAPELIKSVVPVK